MHLDNNVTLFRQGLLELDRCYDKDKRSNILDRISDLSRHINLAEQLENPGVSEVIRMQPKNVNCQKHAHFIKIFSRVAEQEYSYVSSLPSDLQLIFDISDILEKNLDSDKTFELLSERLQSEEIEPKKFLSDLIQSNIISQEEKKKILESLIENKHPLITSIEKVALKEVIENQLWDLFDFLLTRIVTSELKITPEIGIETIRKLLFRHHELSYDKIKLNDRIERLDKFLKSCKELNLEWEKSNDASTIFNRIINFNHFDSEQTIKVLTLFKNHGHDLNMDSKTNLLCTACTRINTSSFDEERTLITFLLDQGSDVNREDSEDGKLMNLILSFLDTKTLEKVKEKQLDFDEVKAVKTFTYKKFNDNQKLKQSNLLKSERFKDVRVSVKKIVKTLLISHAYSIKGKSSIKNDQDLFDLEGTGGAYKMYKIISKELRKFINSRFKAKQNISYEGCLTALDFSSKTPTSEQLLEEFEKGNWVLINAGYDKHSVAVLFKKNMLELSKSRMIICNRGALKGEKSIQSFTFNHVENPLTVQIIKLIRMKSFTEKCKMNIPLPTKESYENLITSRLPRVLPLEKDEKTDDLSSLEKQQVGNCTFASAEMAAKTMIMLDTLDDNDTNLKKGIDREFEKIRCFMQLNFLENYLKMHDQKDFPYAIDENLVNTALINSFKNTVAVGDDALNTEIHRIVRNYRHLIPHLPEDFLKLQLSFEERLKKMDNGYCIAF